MIFLAQIWTMGELLCEVMRPSVDMPLDKADVFVGPFPSGAPAIFIDTVARLGHKCGIIGGVGNDDFGKCLTDRFLKDGVNTSHVAVYKNGTTGVAFVTYFGDGSRRFLYHFPDTPATRSKAPDISELGNDIRYFHIMGCSLMAKKEFGLEIIKLMNALADNGTEISFDPNIRPELMKDSSVYEMTNDVMQECNVFLPGVTELLTITGKSNIPDAIDVCFNYPKLKIVVLKKGELGCAVYTKENSFDLGVYKVDTVDPTGAGDCFDGAFLCGLLEGKDLLEAAKMASAAAALNAAVLGPMEGNISRQTIEEMINNSQ